APHPLQDGLRRADDRRVTDRRRGLAQPLARARGVRAAEPGDRHRRAAVKLGWLLITGGVVIAWLARGLVLPVFLAMTLAYLLTPAVAWADAPAVRRSVAVAALFLVIVGGLGSAGVLLGPGLLTEASALVERLPGLATQIDRGLD